jgi:hypothetical protein
VTTRPTNEPGTGTTPSDVPWPAGPHYFDLTGSEGSIAWVRYRVWVADWYVRTLQRIAGPEQNYDRFVGVEMALDGALNSLSSAFDAGTALIIKGAENALDVAETDRLPTHWYSWNSARDLLKTTAIGTDADGTSNDLVWRVILDVDNALAGEKDAEPFGWLAKIRRLRNRVAHQDTLARRHQLGGPSTVHAFGQEGQDAFSYLAAACDQVHDLTEQMASLAVYLGAREVTAGRPRPRWFAEKS